LNQNGYMLDTWRVVTGAYWFGWIRSGRHWILVDLGGQDQLIPLRVSDLLGALRSRSDGEKRKKREGTHLGFTVDAGNELAH
jgi:hypothetical protein